MKNTHPELATSNFYIHVYPMGDGSWEVRYSSMNTVDHGGGQIMNSNPLTEAEADSIAKRLDSDDTTQIIKHDAPPRTYAEWLAGAKATH